MKAGIYQRRDNKKLIYVAKDRSVRAHELTDCHPIVAGDWRVSAQQKEQVVAWPRDADTPDSANVYADRVADAPNGCTDHAQALFDYRLEQRAQATPPTGEGHNRQLGAYAAGVVENHLADRPPAEERRLQPSAAMLQNMVQDTKVELVLHGWAKQYERAAKLGIVTIVGDEIIINDFQAWTAFQNNEAADNHLADHPPEQRVEQPDTDVTNPEPATPDFAQRAQAQVDIVNAYERAKKDLQVLLYGEEQGAIRWNGHDWEVLDLLAWEAIEIEPPRLLPVLPAGWAAERAKQYKGSNGRQRWALAAAQGTGSQYHAGGFTGDFGLQPGEVPVILERGEFRTVDFKTAERLAASARQGAASLIQSFEVTATGCTSEEQAKNLVEKYRKVFGPTPVNRDPELLAQVNAQFRPSELRTFDGPCRWAGGEVERYQERVRAGELRLIGKQSKRKHRKAGHSVFWCAPLRSWVWEVGA